MRDSQDAATANLTNRPGYEDYLTGLGYYERYDLPGHIELAIQAFKLSITKDATFSLAYASLAQAYAMQFREHSDPGLLHDAQSNAGKAVALDNQISSTYVALGQVDELTNNNAAIKDYSTPYLSIRQIPMLSRALRAPSRLREGTLKLRPLMLNASPCGRILERL